jgi:hypothetical protein
MSEAAQPDNWLKTAKPGRLTIAVLMAAPIAGAVVALVLALTVFRGDPAAEGTGAAAVIGIVSGAATVMATGFMLGAVIGWPVTLALGLPAHAVLLRKTSAKIGWYALGGGVVGAVAGALRLVQTSTFARDAILLHLAMGAVTGTLAALVFWWLRRPDSDAAEFKPRS